MINILIFILSAIFIAAAITFAASLDSRIAGEAFGYSFDAPSGLIVGGLIAALVIAIYGTAKIKDIIAFRERMRVRDREARQTRGIAALTRGLEAVSIGDASDASHHARIAERQLDDIPLTRLLSAQAAHLSGDRLSARRNFEAMLDAPETEFLGLKGMFHLEAQDGDERQAKEYAQRAFDLRRNARWAFDAVIELALSRGEWGDLRAALEQATRNKLIDADLRARGLAAAMTASAYDLLTSDETAALVETEAALKLAPGFVPAVVLAAKQYVSNNKISKAEKVIETAFGVDPHPALISNYRDVIADYDNSKKAARWRKLASKNADAPEASQARAHALLLEEDWRGAVKELETILADRPAPAYALMAAAAVGLHGDGADSEWLRRATTAPRDPRPGAAGDFQLTRAGWASLIREYMDHGRLSPPSLETQNLVAPAEDISRLLAPPIEEPVPESDANEAALADDIAEDVDEEVTAALDEQSSTDDAQQTSGSEDGDAQEAALRAARGIR